MRQRLNKIIAQSGFCSRRQADELIRQQKVKINGKIITTLGMLVDPEKDTPSINNQPLKLEKKIYILLNKPKGYITTTKDIHAREKVFDLLPSLPVRLFAVGRLDKDTSGLLILTNDGILSYQLTHPKFRIERVYEVLVKNYLESKTIKKITSGEITIDNYKTSPCGIKLIFRNKDTSKIQLTLYEGRKRQIRKMFALAGHPVIDLKRIRFGKLKLEDLNVGHWRYLERKEIL